jgi:hypothetical protein
MSDWEQAPGTTAVIPQPTGGDSPPSTPPSAPSSSGHHSHARAGAPLWVLIALVLASALVTGTVVYLIAGGSDARLNDEIATLRAGSAALEQRVNELTAQVKSAEASAAAAAAAAAAGVTTPAETGATTVATEKQFTFITKITGSSAKGYQLTADYAQMLTGTAAATAATAHGDESPPPNDYYIVNDNKKLRLFPLSKTAKIIVLGWSGEDSTAAKTITVGQFMDVMPGGASPQDPWRSSPYNITITGGTVTKVEQVYLP